MKHRVDTAKHNDEKKALDKAQKNGVFFEDVFKISGKDELYPTRAAAKKAAKKKDVIIQIRQQRQV